MSHNQCEDHSNNNQKEEILQKLREQLHRDGFVKIPKSIFYLDSDTVETLRERFDHLFQGKFETGIYPDEIHWRQGISRPDATREICNGWKADTEIYKAVASKALGQLACRLMDWTSSRIGQDDVLHKPPRGGGPVAFHQDAAYISDNFIPQENNCLTMWMALDDADAETGALQYAPGSHLWKQKQEKESTDDKDNDNINLLSFHVPAGEDYLTPLRQAAKRAKIDPEEAVASIQTISVPTGEMVVHRQDVWHGSGPNISETRHRRSLVAHILDGQVQWQTNPHYIYGRYYIRGEMVPREDFFPISYSTR